MMGGECDGVAHHLSISECLSIREHHFAGFWSEGFSTSQSKTQTRAGLESALGLV